MIIAIVGSSHCGTDAGYEQITTLVKYYHDLYPASVSFMSGGARGIDSMAKRVCVEQGCDIVEYLPAYAGWPAYKERNLRIAREADKVYSFVDPLKDKSCYHCRKEGKDDQHQVTGGCYTGAASRDYEVVVIE